ncbi:hypothetical protein O0L34_g14738 [Tuta absoluta]|nr:hypothetical protein O0L34_g14738 [Tuta absoluta]
MVQKLMADLKVLIGKRAPPGAPPPAPLPTNQQQQYTRRDLKMNLHRHMSIVLDSRSRRAARACPPDEVAVKPCYASPPRLDRPSWFRAAANASGRARIARRMTSVKTTSAGNNRAQCRQRGLLGRTRTLMEDGRCATCEALGRRSLSSKLLQVATAQAHLKTCPNIVSPPDHDADLASRALAAKRRKSIAGLKLNLLQDVQSRPTTTEAPRSLSTRRNTWCTL